MKPLLIDLDGVLRIGNRLADDADDFLEYLAHNRVPACILSNTTRYPASHIKQFFASQGIDLHVPILTALDATIAYVNQHYQSYSVYCQSEAKAFFGDLEESNNPGAVVIGDMGDGWNYELLNEIFSKVMAGAEIVAMQKNRYWQAPSGELVLDAGPFIEAIEYATSKSSILIGKPSGIFFKQGLENAGVFDEKEFIMLGDDLISDVKASKDNGGLGVLIMTGKTTPAILEASSVKPDRIVKNLKEFIPLIEHA